MGLFPQIVTPTTPSPFPTVAGEPLPVKEERVTAEIERVTEREKGRARGLFPRIVGPIVTPEGERRVEPPPPEATLEDFQGFGIGCKSYEGK